jgi:glycosyltransferase involved in cell wall biosynthesis
MKNKEIKNILFYGDYNCTTGFGNVSHQLIENWRKNTNLKITILGINDFSEKAYQKHDNVLVLPCLAISRDKDLYARVELLKLLNFENFDVFFGINDVEIFNELNDYLVEIKKERKKNNRKKIKSILYFPVDSNPKQKDLNVLNFFDAIFTYTNYAKQVMQPLVSDSIFNKIKIVPHGVDKKTFFPIEKSELSDFKKEIFGKDDVFVFGTVNRNSVRKDIGTLMIGYAMYKQRHQHNTALYLHTNPIDNMGINCYELAERLGLEVGKDVFFPKGFSENKGFSESELNKIYNIFDCFITTTTAEGWGLSVTEAMATKTLVVCPKHTSLLEITENENNAFCFKFENIHVFLNDREKLRYVSTPGEVCHLMNIIYNIPNDAPEVIEAANKKIENAYNYVSKLKWNAIAKTFENNF